MAWPALLLGSASSWAAAAATFLNMRSPEYYNTEIDFDYHWVAATRDRIVISSSRSMGPIVMYVDRGRQDEKEFRALLLF